VKQADQAAGISNCLLIPNHLLFRTMALVLGAVFVFLDAELLICLTDGKHQKQRVGGPRDEGEQFRLVDAEDIVESQLLGQAELVDKRGHDVRIVLCYRESVAAAPTADMMAHPEG
jgi:hypothetical protein